MSNSSGQIERGHVGGYLTVSTAKVPDTYGAGYSMYVAAWPLLDQYPGNRFQTGLFGTWMFARNDSPKPEIKMYSDIEGGLGWWRDTQYATETPKFIMGGVALEFVAWANGPGAGKGRNWERPSGKYGVVQLSPWILWPPDGLNLKQGTCGELFGYGYLPLPLTEAKTTTAGTNVPTGDHCWTLFLNTENFKGPVAFFAPYFFSSVTVDKPELAGLFLDSRPSNPNRSMAMETQYIPSVQATNRQGQTYARIAPTSFPSDEQGNSVLIHQTTVYSKKALWDKVKTWFEGGTQASGKIDAEAATVQSFSGTGRATWAFNRPGVSKENKSEIAWDTFATLETAKPETFGYKWNGELVTRRNTARGNMVTIPEYYMLTEIDGKGKWIPVHPDDVPPETGLAGFRFSRPDMPVLPPYVTPEDPDSCWKKPGPVAGPFNAYPGDGTVVTYYWYRFADQPAMLNADLSGQDREKMQAKVEMIHRQWTRDREYLAPPGTGRLAAIDQALIVTPPEGLEIGYVPVVTRQGPQK